MNLRLLVWPILGVLLAGCTHILVATEQADDAHLGAYQSYAISDIDDQDTDPALVNRATFARIQDAISDALEDRGYRPSPRPDLRLALYLKVEDKVHEYTRYFGGSSYYGRYFGYDDDDWPARTETIDYREGILIVDAIDVAADRRVWHGVIEAEFSRSRPLGLDQIREAIEELFQDFPRPAP